MEEYGSFIVEGYDKISTDVCREAFGALKELFDLPVETKMKNKYEKPLSGYVGQIAKLPLHESMGIDDAVDPAAVADFTTLMWTHHHPNHDFSEKVHEYAKLTAELDKTVTRMLFESYGVEKYHDGHVESTTYLLRLLKNRAPVGDEPHLGTDTEVGVNSHTDKNSLTILHQNQVEGLEVQTKDGSWIKFQPSTPNSFIVIIADCLSAWLNGRLHSTYHRVMMSGNEARYSLGLFSFPKADYLIKVPEELVDEQHPLLFKPFYHKELLSFFYTEVGQAAPSALHAFCGV
ncbi:unnamed protein product [Linum tenue]|uniref:Fe2OG dioxygenase domain-containing protein n=1 Tax=Linum tenue TaxID=586396 RepID=A0AAV0KKM7_9ROSI|nr:unnamed protein product [Linum tenue]